MTGAPLLRLAPALLGLLLSTPSLAQTLGHGQDDGISTLRVMLTLLLCLVLAAAAAFALRARMGHGSIGWPIKKVSRRLELLDSIRLPNQVDLSIIRCDEEEILVATSAQGLIVVRDEWKGQSVGDMRQP
jgi:hypothetical protein